MLNVVKAFMQQDSVVFDVYTYINDIYKYTRTHIGLYIFIYLYNSHVSRIGIVENPLLKM